MDDPALAEPARCGPGGSTGDDSEVAPRIARISRNRDELKLISLMRLMIFCAVFGMGASALQRKIGTPRFHHHCRGLRSDWLQMLLLVGDRIAKTTEVSDAPRMDRASSCRVLPPPRP